MAVDAPEKERTGEDKFRTLTESGAGCYAVDGWGSARTRRRRRKRSGSWRSPSGWTRRSWSRWRSRSWSRSCCWSWSWTCRDIRRQEEVTTPALLSEPPLTCCSCWRRCAGAGSCSAHAPCPRPLWWLLTSPCLAACSCRPPSSSSGTAPCEEEEDGVRCGTIQTSPPS